MKYIHLNERNSEDRLIEAREKMHKAKSEFEGGHSFGHSPQSGEVAVDSRTISPMIPTTYGAPGGARTPDLMIRSHSLYPTELRAHASSFIIRVRNCESEIACRRKMPGNRSQNSDSRSADRMPDQRLSRSWVSRCPRRAYSKPMRFMTRRTKGCAGQQMLLRLRQVGRATSSPGRARAMPVRIRAGRNWKLASNRSKPCMQILDEHRLSSSTFRYEKYRTEFVDRQADGARLRSMKRPLETSSNWKDRLSGSTKRARTLGFGSADYVLDSYGRLYLALLCQTVACNRLNMVFASHRLKAADATSENRSRTWQTHLSADTDSD